MGSVSMGPARAGSCSPVTTLTLALQVLVLLATPSVLSLTDTGWGERLDDSAEHPGLASEESSMTRPRQDLRGSHPLDTPPNRNTKGPVMLSSILKPPNIAGKQNKSLEGKTQDRNIGSRKVINVTETHQPRIVAQGLNMTRQKNPKKRGKNWKKKKKKKKKKK